MNAAELNTAESNSEGVATLTFSAPPFGLEPLRDFSLVAVEAING